LNNAMTKNNKNSDKEINKAKRFFSKKLEVDYTIDKSFEESTFRDLDDENLKISKIKARIDVLRKKNKNLDSKNTGSYSAEKLEEYENTSNTNINDNLKIFQSNTNVDNSGQYLKNFKFEDKVGQNIYIFCLKEFEINSKLIKSGTIIKIPKFLILNLLKLNLVRLLNKYEIQKFKKEKKLDISETIKLSEVKRSRLNNSKKL
tara:strand:- start:70 stop:678 length:609 start_codon:yes stop_codon:yes gene_type:complete